MPFNAKDLQGAEFDEVRFLISELVPEGVTLLSGSPKVGKSWMALGMCIGVATGGTFLQQDCTRGRVLYLALEDNPRRIQSRLRMCMGGEEFPANLDFDCSWDRFPLGLRELDRMLASEPYSMIVIDTLEMVRPPRRANPYEDDYRAIASMRALAYKHRVAIVVVHHNRKTQTDSAMNDIDPIERVSGTMGLTGAVDAIHVLSRIRGATMGELHITGKDVEEQSLVVKLDTYLGLWYVYEKGTEIYVR
jgi:RecA-family ATPase